MSRHPELPWLHVIAGTDPYAVRRINLAAIAAMEKAQGGECATCHSGKPGGRFGKFAMDHCHKTGFVRGLLCNRCNMRLGRWKDDAGRMRAAADKFEKAKPPRAKILRAMADYVERFDAEFGKTREKHLSKATM